MSEHYKKKVVTWDVYLYLFYILGILFQWERWLREEEEVVVGAGVDGKQKNKDSEENSISESASLQLHPYLMIPFGHGTRMCAGRRFAEQDMYTALARILQKYHLELVKPEEEMEQVYHTLLFPKKELRLRFVKRETWRDTIITWLTFTISTSTKNLFNNLTTIINT